MPADSGPHPQQQSRPGTFPPAPRRAVVSFALWDGGMSAFSSVILTFVFATYVTSAVATQGAVGADAVKAAADHGSQVLTGWQAAGSVAIALLAPLLGNLADSGGARNVLLRITTLATVVVVGLLAVVKLDADYLVTGAVLISLAVVTSELAGVFVNSVLPEISTPAHRGRVSGTAWAVGYWGSILCLGLVLVLFVMPGTGLLGITADAGWNFRAIALFVAAWILVGTLPLMLWAPRPGRGGTGAVGVSGAAAAACRAAGTGAPRERWTPWQGYAQIARRIVRTFREDPRTLAFLVASAIYRDGLGTVFAVAGVLAANAYGFSTVEVIIFGIAANLVAGFGVFVGGFVDDRVGSRAVIIGGCTAILAFGTVMLLFDSTAVFWAVGLVVCAFVGPVQSASRNLLTRLSKPGRETENFGLYATTGRALGFLGTSLFSLCVWLFSDTRMGILGILVVMAVGLAAFVPIKLGEAGRPAQDVETGAGAGTRADEGGSPRG